MKKTSEKRTDEERTGEAYELALTREYKVVKANDIIQKTRFQLSMQEQKIILYLISKIKPDDMVFCEHVLEIRDFCKVCGLDEDNGANYRYIKQTLKALRDKSMWIALENGSETLLSWLDTVTINQRSGAVIIKISEKMKPYLLQLQVRFTQYELLNILAMQSQYSIRLYELLKSYEYKRHVCFSIEELKRLLSAEKYVQLNDFKRFVLETAMREINELSDLTVTHTFAKEGRRFTEIKFSIKMKRGSEERMRAWAKIDEVINPGQMSLFEKYYGERP